MILMSQKTLRQLCDVHSFVTEMFIMYILSLKAISSTNNYVILKRRKELDWPALQFSQSSTVTGLTENERERDRNKDLQSDVTHIVPLASH